MKSKLRIEIADNEQPKVIYEQVNGTVWLSKSELPELFGVSQQMINACIDSLFKQKVFRAENVSRYDLSVSGNTIKYDMQAFNLEVIIALAFRIQSKNAEILREWIIRKTCQPNNILQISKSENDYLFSLN